MEMGNEVVTFQKSTMCEFTILCDSLCHLFSFKMFTYINLKSAFLCVVAWTAISR